MSDDRFITRAEAMNKCIAVLSPLDEEDRSSVLVAMVSLYGEVFDGGDDDPGANHHIPQEPKKPLQAVSK